MGPEAASGAPLSSVASQEPPWAYLVRVRVRGTANP